MNHTDLININLNQKLLDLLNSTPNDREEIKHIQWLREKIELWAK